RLWVWLIGISFRLSPNAYYAERRIAGPQKYETRGDPPGFSTLRRFSTAEKSKENSKTAAQLSSSPDHTAKKELQGHSRLGLPVLPVFPPPPPRARGPR